MFYKQKKSQVCIITVVELISMGFWVAGIIILGVGSNQKCGFGCVEKSCLSTYYEYYPCDCGRTCQNKSVVTDSVYSLGVALLLIGIISSIIGSILLCSLRRRFYRMQPPIPMQVGTVIVQGMPLQGGVIFQQGIPVQYVQQGAPGYIYAQGMAQTDYPPQNFAPLNYPQQNYPPQNYAPQNYAQQNLPPVVNYGIPPIQGQINQT